MRKRFEQQLLLGQLPISEIRVKSKSTNALEQLVAALKELYCNKEYSEKIFSILEDLMEGKDKNNGRPGMNLWTIFVLAQVRLCLNYSYDMLHHQANNDRMLRCLIGVECDHGFGDRLEFEYQQVYDNVSRISDQMLVDINAVIVEFGHKQVFKKKEDTALRLKTDSFVVESNVHFPTDYNLLWDCIRKCLDMIGKLQDNHPSLMKGWRKRKLWYRELKSLMREVGRVSVGGGKQKEERLKEIAGKYLAKASLLLTKLDEAFPSLPVGIAELGIVISLERYMKLMRKHIDLVERRIIKGEDIPHEEKMFSIFETYTEWITKGKLRPGVELGKKVGITTDQWGLILDYQIMEHQQDRDVVIELADRLLSKHGIISWSFDKGYWNATNKDLLNLYIDDVIMPKLGKLSTKEAEIENSRLFKRLKNKHSAIESNINELEHRGLDRCPDRGKARFCSYIGLAVCAYNLKKIGRAILKERCKEEERCLKAA